VATAKAAELEDFEAGDSHTNTDKDDVYSDEDANSIVEKFVSLPLDTLNPDGVLNAVTALMSDASSHRNKRARVN